jgi:hypothetical protein
MDNERIKFLLDRAEQAAEQANSAEALGSIEISAAYRRAEELWRKMAEQAKMHD